MNILVILAVFALGIVVGAVALLTLALWMGIEMGERYG